MLADTFGLAIKGFRVRALLAGEAEVRSYLTLHLYRSQRDTESDA